VFLTFETGEKVVQINAKQLTRVEYELDRVAFHFAGGGSWVLQGPTARQVRKLKKKLGGAAAVGKLKVSSAALLSGPSAPTADGRKKPKGRGRGGRT
jgi:hypothetical protein